MIYIYLSQYAIRFLCQYCYHSCIAVLRSIAANFSEYSTNKQNAFSVFSITLESIWMMSPYFYFLLGFARHFQRHDYFVSIIILQCSIYNLRKCCISILLQEKIVLSSRTSTLETVTVVDSYCYVDLEMYHSKTGVITFIIFSAIYW